MDRLEIKQGSFIQQTQYFIPVEIYLSVVPACSLWESDFFTCPVGQPLYKIYLSDISFHWYRTNVNVEACPGFLVGPVLLIFSFFVVVILFVFTF